MKTRRASNREANAKKQRPSCDRIVYSKKHTYDTFEGVLVDMSDAIVEYMEQGTSSTTSRGGFAEFGYFFDYEYQCATVGAYWYS